MWQQPILPCWSHNAHIHTSSHLLGVAAVVTACPLALGAAAVLRIAGVRDGGGGRGRGASLACPRLLWQVWQRPCFPCTQHNTTQPPTPPMPPPSQYGVRRRGGVSSPGCVYYDVAAVQQYTVHMQQDSGISGDEGPLCMGDAWAVQEGRCASTHSFHYRW